MGSYLSVLNNTPHEWRCNVGTDISALKIAIIIMGVIGAAATVIATAGTAAPLAAALTANGIVSVFGVSTAALATVTGAAASVSGIATATGIASSFGIMMARGIDAVLADEGYVKILPGEKVRWGRMTLSLCQQSICKRTYLIDERTVVTETVNMRPIFSGSTANSDRTHDIQWWINKNGVEVEEVVAEDAQYNTKSPQKKTRVLHDASDPVIFYEPSVHNYTDFELKEGQVVIFI